jgi:outer membrane protein TolC
VHVAAVREREIRASADLDVAQAALNDALGMPLDTQHTLATALSPLAASSSPVGDYEHSGISNRPDVRETKLATRLAQTQVADARSNWLPQVGFHSAFEADRQRFYDRGGANWVVSLGLRWNVFNGFADKAKVEESEFALLRSEATERYADSATRLEVRRAYADLRAASERIEAVRAVVTEAEESLRISQNRYEAGLSTVTDLLHVETALLDSRTRYMAAVHDQRVAATMLEMAAGTLNADSEVLK